jgi:nucleoside-diphosphate-sugar epimerase
LNIVVTGATGYVGRYFTFMLVENGHNVIALTRNKPSLTSFNWISYDLLNDDEPILPEKSDVLVHLAANTDNNQGLKEEKEVSAAIHLINAAQKVGAKFVFVSSQTADANAPTAYGRIKWCIEQEVLSKSGSVVRPGQVYGGQPSGLYGLLLKTVKNSLLLPSFILPSPSVQPIHVADLSEGLLRICENVNLSPAVYCLAESRPILFSNFLKEIAKTRLHIKRFFLPVPVILVKSVSLVIGKKLSNRLGLDRIISLIYLPVMETQFDLNTLNLKLRDLRSGMHSSGDIRRREILQEAYAMLSYILKSKPSYSVLRRYLKIIEKLRDAKSLGLPSYYIRRPFLFSLLDKRAWQNKYEYDEFIWRLDAATMLAEATPYGGYYFLGLGDQQGFLKSLLTMILAIISEVYWRVLGFIFLPFIRLSLTKMKNRP